MLCSTDPNVAAAEDGVPLGASYFYQSSWPMGTTPQPFLARRADPQPGMHKAWQTGTHTTLRCRAVLEHSTSALHVGALSLWESGGTSSTVIGELPEPVCNAIFGLFMLVYRISKRMVPFENFSGDAKVATMVSGTIIEHGNKPCPPCTPSPHPSGHPRGASQRMLVYLPLPPTALRTGERVKLS